MDLNFELCTPYCRLSALFILLRDVFFCGALL